MLLRGKLEGIGWFTYEIFKRLTAQHPEIEWVFLFDRPFSDEFVFGKNVTPMVVRPPARHPYLWHVWYEIGLPRAFRKLQPDLFISPDGHLSLRAKIKSLPVIHDLNFEKFPENIPKIARHYYLKYFPKFAEKADRIATVSSYSKKDISNRYKISEKKIDLVYNGVGNFFESVSFEKKKEIQLEINQGNPYFIFIGALNPRKNITGMLRAFELYKKRGGKNGFLIVGEKMFLNQDIEMTYENHPFKDEITFAGRLEGNALSEVLASAEALLFVSHFEGFGIPIVEAFQCKTPVITSTETSMPEVAGDAAILCPPNAIEEIANAMFQMEDEKIRRNLIKRGEERSRLFSWDKSAEMMWKSIEKTLAQ